MVYDKKRPRFVGYPLFGLLLCFTLYINLCIYKKNLGVVVLLLLLVLHQTEVVWNVVLFFKNAKTHKHQNCYI